MTHAEKLPEPFRSGDRVHIKATGRTDVVCAWFLPETLRPATKDRIRLFGHYQSFSADELERIEERGTMTYELNSERKATVLRMIMLATGDRGRHNERLIEHAMHFGSSFEITPEEVEVVLAMTVAEAVSHRPE